MHLSRLSLDPRHAQVRRDLGNPYDMHRTLTRVFASGHSERPPRFLWRLEPSPAWSDPILLVQSAHSANWGELSQLGGYLKSEVVSKGLNLEQLIQPSATYRFRLFANPTVTREGKRFGLTSEEAQLEWLQRQGKRCGFNVSAALVTSSGVIRGRKASSQISLQQACFEGILQAQNADDLASALRAGIGPGKAFGLGLLSIARMG
jgi:CRISPR system Cascade subunit CasE